MNNESILNICRLLWNDDFILKASLDFANKNLIKSWKYNQNENNMNFIRTIEHNLFKQNWRKCPNIMIFRNVNAMAENDKEFDLSVEQTKT